MVTMSLCMIVRDEEQSLARCLRSVQGVFDEIVIVDTGSVDATVQIAGEFTPAIYEFGWIDDFGAARNAAFSHATMDYLMWLDADDVMSEADRDKLVELKNTLDPLVDAIYMPYNTVFDELGNVVQSARRLRVVKRLAGFSWEGVVHEDLALNQPYRYLNSDIAVIHSKWTDGAGSARRNLAIYEKLFATETTVRLLDLFHYARELEQDGQLEKAVEYYRKFVDSGHAQPDAALYALDRLARCHFQLGELDKEWECTLKSLDFDVPQPQFSCRFGERFLNRNQFQQAIFWYELALQDPGNSAEANVSENYPFRTWLPHKQLGLCFYRLGNYQRSLDHNIQARRYVSSDADLDTNIAMLQQLIKDEAKSQEAPRPIL